MYNLFKTGVHWTKVINLWTFLSNEKVCYSEEETVNS